MVSEKVLVLAERIKKKAAPGRFHKESVQKISYFNKDIYDKKKTVDQ